MKTTTLYRIGLRKNRRIFLGAGHYHWVATAPNAGYFTAQEARERIAHILTLTDDPEGFREQVRVVPVTGGWKDIHHFLPRRQPVAA